MLNISIDVDGSGVFLNETISNGAVIGLLLFVIAIYVAFYLLRSFGLYKIAKNQGIEKAYLVWIPAVWMFVACKIIGNTSVFGVSAEKSAVWVTVVFSFAVFLPLISGFLEYFPYVMYYLQGGTLTIVSNSTGSGLMTGGDFVNLFDTNAINIIINIISYLNIFLQIAEIFILITVYIAIFKMFWPEHYILGAVLSFLGLFPIIIFAVRNRKAVDFNEYFRQRYYGAGYTPYGNNYYNNQANSQFNNQPNNNDDPFDEFSNRPEEPFGEFSADKNNNNQSDNKDDFFS